MNADALMRSMAALNRFRPPDPVAPVPVEQPIAPDVQSFAEHFEIDAKMARWLDSELKSRPVTRADDLQALYGCLEHAKNPAAVLRIKIDEMAANMFIAKPESLPEVAKMMKMYELDDASSRRLAEWMQHLTNENRDASIGQMHRHLETSNKASARLMMITKGLKPGDPLPEPEKRVAPGSYLDKQAKAKTEKKDDRRDRSRDRRRQRDDYDDRDRRRYDDRDGGSRHESRREDRRDEGRGYDGGDDRRRYDDRDNGSRYESRRDDKPREEERGYDDRDDKRRYDDRDSGSRYESRREERPREEKRDYGDRDGGSRYESRREDRQRDDRRGYDDRDNGQQRDERPRQSSRRNDSRDR